MTFDERRELAGCDCAAQSILGMTTSSESGFGLCISSRARTP
jgi:hypothetical protein